MEEFPLIFHFQPPLLLLLFLLLQGITFSVMTASWDPERRESGFLGIDKFQRNMDSLREVLLRWRENALIRERVSKMSQAEIQAALSGLDNDDEHDRDSDCWNP
jgi:hypothetical protein